MANEKNLNPFVKGDPRCHRKGRPKGKTSAVIFRELLKKDPEKLIYDPNADQRRMIDFLKEKKAIKTTKDLLHIVVINAALSGDLDAFDKIIKQLGENEPEKADVNINHLIDVTNLSDADLDALRLGKN